MFELYEQKQNYKQNLIDAMIEIVTQGYGSEGKRINFLKKKMSEAIAKLEMLKKKLSVTKKQEKILNKNIIKTEESIAKKLSRLKKLIKEEWYYD